MTATTAICFDMDGLLVDTEAVHIRAHVVMLQKRSIPSDEKMFIPFVGKPTWETMAEIKRMLSLPGDIGALVAEQEETFLQLLSDAPVYPLPGAAEFLREAKSRGVPMAVVTSSSRQIARAVLVRLLASLGVEVALPEQFFSAVVCGDDVANRKPDPDLYLLAAQRLRAKPSACLAFEDSATGVAAAKAAGMRCIGVPSAYVPAKALADADKVYVTLREAFLAGGWPDAARREEMRKARARSHRERRERSTEPEERNGKGGSQ